MNANTLHNKTNDVFCANPFLHLIVETDGRMSFCCLASRSTDDMNINTHSVEQAWQDPVRLSVIDSINKGEQNPACKFCWQTELLGSESYRQDVNSRYLLNQNNFTKFLPNITLGDTFVDIEIQHTNICNLKCGMCFEKNTHSLAAENRQLGIVNEQKIYDWDITKVKDKISDTKWLNIRGGEPLINQRLQDQVNLWIEEGLLDNTTLCITTNATKIDRWWPTLERIPKLQLAASVDGWGDIYNYLRYPGNWETTSNNILRLQTLASVSIHCVVQNMNIFSLHKLLEWADQYQMPVNLYPLDNPEIYRTINLPQGLLDSSIKRLENLDLKQQKTVKQISGILKYIQSNASDMKDWDAFWNMTYRRQSIRGNNILDAFPELSNYTRPRK